MSEWDALCGERTLNAIRTDVRHPFDADASGVALDLGNMTVFVFEDPTDGYRSCAAPMLVAEHNMYEFGCSPSYLRVPVLISRWTKAESEYGNPDGIVMRDRRNGNVILILGTDNSDDYYPSFTCDWRPQNLAENAASPG